jgi:hypothetical protein
MGIEPEQSGCWINRSSSSGVEIREDVRLAASAIWRRTQQRTQSRIGDNTDTAALMEVAAAKASVYLNALGDVAAAANIQAVLMKIFCRVLTRYAAKLRRLLPVGNNIELHIEPPNWEERLVSKLVFEKFEHYLSADGVAILTSRRHGHEWEEIAAMLRLPVTVVRSRFWREIENAKTELGIGRKKRRRYAKLQVGRGKADRPQRRSA